MVPGMGLTVGGVGIARILLKLGNYHQVEVLAQKIDLT
jgi:hypothetical protein